MSGLVQNYVAIDVLTICTLLILMRFIAGNVFFLSEMKQNFIIASALAALITLAQMLTVLFENHLYSNHFLQQLSNVVGFAFTPFVALVLSRAFLTERVMSQKFLIFPVWVNLAFVLTSPWTGLIFHAEDGFYARGPLYAVFVVALLCAYVVLIMRSLQAVKQYQSRTRIIFLLLFLFISIGSFIQITLPQIHISWAAVALGLILYYAYFTELTEMQDRLTGLLNRNVFDYHANQNDDKPRESIIVFDIDNFKQINDVYGHQWGDACLKLAGGLIKGSFGDSGRCYRIGGDEFCVISAIADEEILTERLSSFHFKVEGERNNHRPQKEIPMISTGFALLAESNYSFTRAQALADSRMYSFKNKRKDNLGLRSH